MGVGHVSPRPLPRAGPGPHVPRCERREVGEDGAQALSTRRASLGAAGERFAAWWLTTQGLVVVGRNVAIDRAEIDIVATDSSTKVAIEVRTVTGDGDPIDAVDPAKRAHVRRLAGRVGAGRVDFLGVGFRSWGIEVHWVPG